MATDRIIIHSAIAIAFLDALKSNLAAFSASSTTTPYVISSASKSRLERVVSDALSAGAHIFYKKNEKKDLQSFNGDTCFAPTILGDVTQDMEIWQIEIFGPVVSYVLVQNEDEAVECANQTEYGLSAAIFTKDLRKGLALARRIESG